MNNLKINLEHTDTYAGEANYSWVRRESRVLPATKDGKPRSDRSIVQIAKKWANLTGVTCRVDVYGDMLAIYPRGIAHVVFVTFGE